MKIPIGSIGIIICGMVLFILGCTSLIIEETMQGAIASGFLIIAGIIVTFGGLVMWDAELILNEWDSQNRRRTK